MIELIRLSDFHWPITVEQFKVARPDVGLPEQPDVLGQVEWSDFGYARIFQTAQPEYDPLTQTVRAITPVKTNGKWYQQWKIVELTPEQIAANQAAEQAALIARYEKTLDAHIDAVAKADRWDSRITACMAAGFINPWQARAKAFADWAYNQCYPLGYQIMAEVQAGTRVLPTIEEFIGMMPKMEWPE